MDRRARIEGKRQSQQRGPCTATYSGFQRRDIVPPGGQAAAELKQAVCRRCRLDNDSIPIPENYAPTIEQIHAFMARLSEAPENAKIVVFCQSGKGRTACMGAAYWIAQGLQPDLAIERMTKRCLDSEWPTPERRRVLQEYERIPSGVQKIRLGERSGAYDQQTNRAGRPHGSIHWIIVRVEFCYSYLLMHGGRG